MALLELYEVQTNSNSKYFAGGNEPLQCTKELPTTSIKLEIESLTEESMPVECILDEVYDFKSEDKTADFKCAIGTISKLSCDPSISNLEEVTKKDLMRLSIADSKVSCKQLSAPEEVQKDAIKQAHDNPEAQKRVCLVCVKRFGNADELRNHMLTHKGYFACQQCGELCYLKINLRKHMVNCRGSETADPCTMDLNVPQLEKQKDTIAVAGTEKLVDLNDCKGEGKTLDLRKCKRRNKILKRYSWHCPFCQDLKFTYVKALQRHVQADHPDYQAIIKRTQTRNTPFKKWIHSCKACVLEFPNLRSFKFHNQSCHGGELTFSCEKCNKTYSDIDALKNHNREYHRNITKFLCDVCGRNCHNATFLRQHRATHDEFFTKLACTLCKKLFDTAVGLSQHMTTHTDKIHTCEICGSKHKLESLLKSHLKSHDKNRPRDFSCNMCEKSYWSSSNLHKHMRQHNGVKNYVCEICSKSYSLASSLKQHLNTHSGERPFKCTMCPKTFMHSGAVYKHGQLKHKGFKISLKGKTEQDS